MFCPYGYFLSKNMFLPVTLKVMPIACLTSLSNRPSSKAALPIENIRRLSIWNWLAVSAADEKAIPRSMELKAQTPPFDFNPSQVLNPQNPQFKPAGLSLQPINTQALTFS